MSGLELVPVAVLALATVTLIVHLRIRSERQLTRGESRRVVLSFVAMALWVLTVRGLAVESFHPCQVDSRALGARGSWYAGFFDCTPQLLSGGAASVLLFFLVWTPIALIAAFCVNQLLRLNRARMEAAQ